jgi:prepilin-type N-terminal cleavage/methylation domain-containing protein
MTTRFRRVSGGGFTLIELLVVITIIGVLISILLPALGKARLEGYKSISLGNMRSMTQAGAGYQTDNKGQLPAVPTGVPVPTTINAWVPWTGWGKFAGGAQWRNSVFDIAPASRPLNPYLIDTTLPADINETGTRKIFQIPGLRDPSDKIGHQQSWNAFQPSFEVVKENTDRTTCYDDVGTSYLLQCKWFFQTTAYVGGNWTKGWRLGSERLRVADSFMPSRMVWVNDENVDITINQQSDQARIKNGYGDINRGVAGYLDGHVRYLKLIPGGEGSPFARTEPWRVKAFFNDDYAVVFPDLKAN